ncbi:hypothetical protein Vadar_032808 [Vaccinium darrowii]|uniref:Uncharacterized protein n=1 Tax=Vaccinium darrowii TaxID=229202 RepID=A0ACB7ZGE9_9ERIC|nr:hypothetical protein Vadar_032808 [Vaccinium darrowii]
MEPMNYSNDYADQLLVEDQCQAKKIVLNRPKQLNAISLQMVYGLLELFLACEEDSNVKLIIMKGNGKTYSVGGDVAGVFRHVFAMPEAALGLFPDIGSTYFLPRLPGFFGEYLGLTGTRLDGAEMLACGLATHFVPEAVDFLCNFL